MSKREELRKRRQQAARRTQLALIGGTVLLALAVVGYIVYQNTRPIGDFVTVERASWPLADGKALGPAGAAVVIQEFSDFQ
jgi:hypothetical protein